MTSISQGRCGMVCHLPRALQRADPHKGQYCFTGGMCGCMSQSVRQKVVGQGVLQVCSTNVNGGQTSIDKQHRVLESDCDMGLWGPQWTGQAVLGFSDNFASVGAMCSGRAEDASDQRSHQRGMAHCSEYGCGPGGKALARSIRWASPIHAAGRPSSQRLRGHLRHSEGERRSEKGWWLMSCCGYLWHYEFCVCAFRPLLTVLLLIFHLIPF